MKVLFFPFLSLLSLNSYFLYFFYTSNDTITLFYKYTKIFDKLFRTVKDLTVEDLSNASRELSPKDGLSFKSFIPSFISLYFFRALFIKTNSS